MQPGDVYKTYSDTKDLISKTNYKPKVGIKTGVRKFVEWYKQYYGLDL